MSTVIVTDLKQWAYCQRIVYYRHVMPGIGKPTFKMEEARSAQDLIESLELRRGLCEYGVDSATRQFGVWLSDETLGLAGKIDLLLVGQKTAAVVDFKLTSGEPSENHRLQLGGYAMLVEGAFGLPVDLGFLYRIPDNRVYTISITEELRSRVRDAIGGINDVGNRQLFPEPTSIRARCTECEYANYCADIW